MQKDNLKHENPTDANNVLCAGWISVENQFPPEDGEQVIVWVKSYAKNKGGFDCVINLGGRVQNFALWDLTDSITHWYKPVKPDCT